MEDYPLNFIEPQVNESFMLCFSSFITEMRKRDHTNNFTIEHIFPTRNELIQWVRGISFHLDFVVFIIRFDKANG